MSKQVFGIAPYPRLYLFVITVAHQLLSPCNLPHYPCTVSPIALSLVHVLVSSLTLLHIPPQLLLYNIPLLLISFIISFIISLSHPVILYCYSLSHPISLHLPFTTTKCSYIPYIIYTYCAPSHHPWLLSLISSHTWPLFNPPIMPPSHLFPLTHTPTKITGIIAPCTAITHWC